MPRFLYDAEKPSRSCEAAPSKPVPSTNLTFWPCIIGSSEPPIHLDMFPTPNLLRFYKEDKIKHESVTALSVAKYRGVTLRATVGDITSQNTDAIVNPANSELIMGGGVAGAIKRRGGAEIEREAMRKAPIPIGKAVATGAGSIPVRYVIHSPTMATPAMRTDLDAVRKATRAALALADELHLSSVALPGMGTGVGGVRLQSAADAMVDEIKKLLDKETGLKEIRLVCLDEGLLKAFDQAISKLSDR